MKLSVGTQTAIHHFLIAGVAAALPVAVLLIDPAPLGVLLGGLLGAAVSAFLYAKVPSAQELADRAEAERLQAWAQDLEREVGYLKSPRQFERQLADFNRSERMGSRFSSRDRGPI